jgi:hypothetical protein
MGQLPGFAPGHVLLAWNILCRLQESQQDASRIVDVRPFFPL